MSVVIVPLAGPDFYTPEFGIRPLFPMRGSTLIDYVLNKRSWMPEVRSGQGQLIFVLREVGVYTTQTLEYINKCFPFASTVVLGDLTHGASFSALAGLSLTKEFNTPVIIDLADIDYELTWDHDKYFQTYKNVDAVVPYFTSDNKKFSYLKLDGVRVLEAREKFVISSNASCGVYYFRNIDAYLRALIFSVQTPGICKYKESFFVCPSINGLIAGDREVHAINVNNVEPISAMFHSAP
ncbi:MAG: hypothetical protein V4732_08875 [Pseudomonadota bacterium]